MSRPLAFRGLTAIKTNKKIFAWKINLKELP